MTTSVAKREIRELVTSMIEAQIERGLIAPLSRWCEQNADLIQWVSVCVTANGSITIFVSRRSVEFDFALSKEISRLELDELEHSLVVDVQQVPQFESPTEATAFLNSNGAVVFYGEPGNAPPEGGTSPELSHFSADAQ